MCTTCGCGDEGGARLTVMTDPPHRHAHDHQHDHPGQAPEGDTRTVVLEQQILAKNDLLAERTRGWLGGRGVRAFNMMSSPGSGKTTLLERTIREVGDECAVSVIEGDQETPLDAERIRATGRPVVQVNTGSGCHLDAGMVARALEALDPESGSVVFIENVGNLVCPALFDLGEAHRVVLASVTEGADKPLKYPQMYRTATLVLINKMDLAPYVDFDREVFGQAVAAINPTVEVMGVSATTGEGLDGWYGYLRGLPRSNGH
jgi:hydrogenase nickel incorporation protein HypB